jgi:integrase
VVRGRIELGRWLRVATRLRRGEIDPPSLADLRKLLIAADSHDPRLGVLLRLAAATGMRSPPQPRPWVVDAMARR